MWYNTYCFHFLKNKNHETLVCYSVGHCGVIMNASLSVVNIKQCFFIFHYLHPDKSLLGTCTFASMSLWWCLPYSLHCFIQKEISLYRTYLRLKRYCCIFHIPVPVMCITKTLWNPCCQYKQRQNILITVLKSEDIWWKWSYLALKKRSEVQNNVTSGLLFLICCQYKVTVRNIF